MLFYTREHLISKTPASNYTVFLNFVECLDVPISFRMDVFGLDMDFDGIISLLSSPTNMTLSTKFWGLILRRSSIKKISLWIWATSWVNGATVWLSLIYMSIINNEIILLNLHILYIINLNLTKFVTSLEKLELFRMFRFVPFHSVL